MINNSNKYPPIPARDSGGGFQINNPDDITPIRAMFPLNNMLLMITDKCTYKMRLADQIDPERQNPTLPPNVQQKVFDHGIESELLCRTLLQANVMFRKEFLSIEIDKAKQSSFDALGDLIAMHEATQTFKVTEKTAIEKMHLLEKKDRSLTIPAVGNVQSHCKNFSQKADHFAKSLMDVVRLFYSDMKKKNWEDLQQLVKSQYGEEDPFYNVLKIVIPILKLVRETRNCLDKANLNGVQVRDFELEKDGSISVPTIMVNFRGCIQERCSISSFMENITLTLLDAFEMIIVHMSSKCMKPLAGFPMTIGFLPENYESWYVRFAYGTYNKDGHFMPCG
ncbi:MAG: hypothetical protein CK426_00365 [Legionella sp.]|nr:MAG: hypothetical protein CK423_09670 [Legionella sp.]PJE00205.1 MAG: hypothetical protein CK426_00365 [Legionella sp.]